jgi:hypothetical protein
MISFYFPDSVDVINPGYCFSEEEHDQGRRRMISEVYPHEVYEQPPYDGMLVSKAIVNTRYTMAQRQRLMRQGIRRFLRLDSNEHQHLKIIGDCGAFSYRNEAEPPYSVAEVIHFYDSLGFDYGISLDHVILGYEDEDDADYLIFPDKEKEAREAEYKRRQDTTLRLAQEFLSESKRRSACFHPMGVAQGWSPKSYATAVEQLQTMGFDYIALGGMVPLKTGQIVACLERIQAVRKDNVRFHLLGISRIDDVAKFGGYGVVSADSTAPLLQAFKSDKDNFQVGSRNYVALRVPQTGENNKLKKLVLSGLVPQEVARRMEIKCMRLLNAYGKRESSALEVVEALCQFEALMTQKKRIKNRDQYLRTLMDRPWEDCGCPICKELGIHVIIFRGAERNRRRGFHNLYNYHAILKGKRLGELTHD